jgi:hypothetical protein
MLGKNRVKKSYKDVAAVLRAGSGYNRKYKSSFNDSEENVLRAQRSVSNNMPLFNQLMPDNPDSEDK